MWSISDNISGWEGSYSRWYENKGIEHRLLLEWGQKDYNVLNSGNNVSYMLLAQDALNDYNNYLESMYYNLIANSYAAGSAEHEEALNKSLEHYSKNLDSIHGLYKSYCADVNTTDKEWLELARKVAIEYRYFPAPMVDLLNIIKPHIKDEVLKIEVDMIQTESLNMASVATANESLQYDACIAVARSLLGQNGKELASFSFDGDNANTIVIDESYANSTIQVRVSLDGGKTWEIFENNQEFTTSKSIKLTDEQVKKINANDDILVGLMGTDKNFCIDIKDGKVLGDSVYLNDDENLLIGDNTSNLEYSIDNGATWKDYTPGLNSDTRIEGNTKVLFRYKPHDVYLQGKSEEFTFTENTVDPKSNYLQLKHVKLYQYCSQENGDKNHAAANFIDGSGKTAWHNTYDGEFDNKFYSVEFDRVRYISKLTYTPGHSFNGRLRSGKIYTSMDGQNWDKVHTFTDLDSNENTKTIALSESVEAKYLKIAVTDTYGNSDGERNKFISGSMLNFYEDTTKEYKADVKIEYSTENKTNKDVTAKLILPKDCVAVGETEHIFKDNGTFEFKYIDANKVEQSIIAEVNNIDRELPTMTYTFDNESLTNKDVTLTITEFSKANVRVVDINEENSVVNPIVMARAINGNTNVTPNVYPNTYTFTENKTVVFTIADEAGNVNTIPVTVNWIDKDAPTADIQYDITTPINGQVKATLVNASEDIIITNLPQGQDYYIFDENGSFTFEFVDRAGNKGTAIANVTWIDKDAPSVYVEYSTTKLTNQSVTATLKGLEEGDIIISEGGDTHEFDSNGSFEFIVQDRAGNESRVTAEVTWIDKEGPKLSLDYSTTSPTNNDVVVTLKGLEAEDIIISEGGDTHTFTSNGSFEFIAQDKVGNESRITAEVTWIDKEGPSLSLDYSTTSPTNNDVVVTLRGLEAEDTIISDGGDTHTFTSNGSFQFIAVDALGNESRITATVNWIDKDAPTATVEYDINSWTNGQVTATLANPSEDITITNTIDGSNTVVFNENGSFTFEFVDKAGNKGSATAEVNWIDKEAPNAKVVYSTTSPTNQNVTATIQEFTESGVTIKNNEGSTSYTFEQNGYFDFILVDKAGNETVIRAEVTWIDKVAPKLSLTYSNENPTNQNVTVTLDGLVEGDEIVNNNGNNTHTFEENGSFEFIVRDKAGNESRITAVVNWIDKIAPTATIAFDYSKAEEGKVIVRLTDFSEEGITILNPSNGQDYYEFTSNGSFTFEFIDKAGNKGSAIADVNWFDFNDIKTILQYEDVIENDNGSSDEVKPDYVVAKLSVDEEKVEILNNNGSNEVKFVKNGVFKFRARMIDTGEEFDIIVEVNWLAETAAEGESPIEIPTEDDSNGGNEDDSSNGSDDSTDKDDNPSEDDSDNSGDNDASEENPDLGPDFGEDYEEEETPVEPPIEEPITPPVDTDNNGGENNGDTSGSDSNGEGNSSNNNLSNGDTSNNLNSNTNNTNSNTTNNNNTNGNNSNSNIVSVSSNNVNSTGANVSDSEKAQINDFNKESNTALSDKKSNKDLENNSSSDLKSGENSSEDSNKESNNIKKSVNKGLFATVISSISILLIILFAWLRKKLGSNK